MVTIAMEKSPILAYYRDKKKPVPSAMIVAKFGDGTDLARARIYETIRRFERRGAIRRVRKGLYQYKQGLTTGAGPTKYEVMWRLLRARRTVTIDDLVEMAGVSRPYAIAFLATMLRNEVVRCVGDGSKYSITVDAVAMPRDEVTAAKKRVARAMEAIVRAESALADIKKIIEEN